MLVTGDPWANLCTVALLALLANLLFGGPPALWSALQPLHPLNLWGKTVAVIAMKLNRRHRDDGTRYRRGRLLVILAVLFLLIAGSALQLFLRDPALSEWVEIILLALFLSARPVWDKTSKVVTITTNASGPIKADRLPDHLMRRDQPDYDVYTVHRAAIEALALAWSGGILAPLLAYLLFSWPGVLIVTGIRAMDRMLGHRSRESDAFGRATAQVDSILQWLPSRLAGCWLCLSALLAPASPLRAWRTMFGQADRFASANTGWPISAMAGALNITLAGPRAVHGVLIPDKWVGNGTSKATVTDVKRARWLYAVSLLVLLLLLLLSAARADVHDIRQSFTSLSDTLR